MTSEGRAETLSPVGTQKAGTRAVSCRFPRYGFHPYTRETHTWKRLVHNGGGDEEQLVVASHCEINEFFTMGTLTAAGWVSRSVEPFMTMMRPIPRNDRNTIEWASWVGCNEKHGGEKKKKKKRKITHGCKFHEPFLRDTSGGGDCRNRTANRDPLGKLREKKRSTFIGEKFVLEERFI